MTVALALAACGGSPEHAERVVLISIDTLRADHVGAWGAEFAHTPTLDALAASGVRFATAISPAPLTLPSHATLLTGLDPPEHGVRHNGVFRLDDDLPTLATQLSGAGFASAAFVGAVVLGRQYGLARGFDTYDDHLTRDRSGAGTLGFAERTADVVVDAALAWLATAPERFLLWIHVYDPHADYRPPPGFAVAFASRPYDGEIAFVDSELGRLLEAVRQRWPAGGTLVAVTSDHGDSLGEHGESTHSHFVYEATQHVPLLLSGPGLPPGRVVREVVALRDVAPTLLELAGAPALEGATGRSLLPLVSGRRDDPRVAYVETLSTQLDWDWSPLFGLRTQRHKYIRAPRRELYDLAEDPDETRNLAAAQPQRLAELDAMLERRLAGSRAAQPNLQPADEDRRRLESLGYVVPAPGPLGLRPGEVGGVDPKDGIEVVVQTHRADRLLVAGRAPEALALLQTLELGAGSMVVQNLLAAAALETGQPRLAETAARRAIALAPLHPAGYAHLAQALRTEGRTEEARATFEELAGLSPTLGAPWRALGEIAEQSGDRETAARHYARALAAPQPDPAAGWHLAALLLDAGRLEEADAVLAGLSGEGPSPALALRLARAQRAAGRAEAALGVLSAATTAHAGWIQLRLERAAILSATGRRPEAEDLYRAALADAERALRPAAGAERAFLQYVRAECLARLGRGVEARQSLARVLAAWQALPAELHAEVRALAERLDLAAPADARGPDAAPGPGTAGAGSEG